MTKDITKLIKEGKMDQARQKARILLAKESIAQQMDQAADMAELSVAQIQANNAMNRMTAMMQQSSKTMNRAQKQTNPERVRTINSPRRLPPCPTRPAFCIILQCSSNSSADHDNVQTLLTLEQFRNQNEEYAMNNNIYQDAMTQSTSVQVSDDAVGELLGKLADDAGVELSQELASASASKDEPVREAAAAEPTPEQEDALQQRLRALRA